MNTHQNVICLILKPQKNWQKTPKTGLLKNLVQKKLKAKNFAAAVSREDIDQGAVLLGMDLNEHITEVITALQKATK